MSSILCQSGLIVRVFHPYQVSCGEMMGPFRSITSQESSILYLSCGLIRPLLGTRITYTKPTMLAAYFFLILYIGTFPRY